LLLLPPLTQASKAGPLFAPVDAAQRACRLAASALEEKTANSAAQMKIDFMIVLL
jgi:hypothetical protein